MCYSGGMETVKLDITIEIRAQDVVDTGVTVEAWNALTDAERHVHYRNAWEAMAEGDNGGVTVLTEGAEGL